MDTEQLMVEIGKYKDKRGYFEKKYLWKTAVAAHSDPITWWKAFCSDLLLSTVPIKILSLPASAAS